MHQVEIFRPTLTRLVGVLNRVGVRFHLTGGVTAVAYGEPRMTQDLDLVIDSEAAKKGIPVLFLHLGGEQRRGELTDGMVADVLPAAKMAVIVKSADSDGLFSKICKERGIPLVAVEKTADAAEVLKGAFKPKI